jgi:hypothetical protein
MDTWLPLIKAWKQKDIKKIHKLLKQKLKVALHLIHSNSFSTKESWHVFKFDHRWSTRLIQKKTGSIVKKWGSSGIHRTSYTRKNPNVYPPQSRITLHTLPWDTLYINIVPKMRFNSKPKVIYKLQKDQVFKKIS